MTGVHGSGSNAKSFFKEDDDWSEDAANHVIWSLMAVCNAAIADGAVDLNGDPLSAEDFDKSDPKSYKVFEYALRWMAKTDSSSESRINFTDGSYLQTGEFTLSTDGDFPVSFPEPFTAGCQAVWHGGTPDAGPGNDAVTVTFEQFEDGGGFVANRIDGVPNTHRVRWIALGRNT